MNDDGHYQLVVNIGDGQLGSIRQGVRHCLIQEEALKLDHV